MSQDALQFSKLKGTRVLVLGGTSGIGFAVTRMFLEGGAAHITVASSNPDKVTSTIARLKSLYPSLSTQSTITGHPCDIGNLDTLESNLQSLLEFATDRGSHKLDHIVHTAGAPSGGIKPLAQTSATDFATTAGRNASSAILVKLATAQAQLDGPLAYLSPGPSSSITLTGGSVDLYPQVNWHLTATSAGGLVALTRALAATVKPVRVNVVAPGAVDTELWGSMGMPAEQLQGLKTQIGSKLPTGRMGRPEDVVELYRGLMLDANTTGMILRSEGGQGLVNFMGL